MMTTHRITYEGPSALAVPTATMLADAEGVKLTSSDTPDQSEQQGDVVLALTVEGSTEAIAAAVTRIRAGLPRAATITIGDAGP